MPLLSSDDLNNRKKLKNLSFNPQDLDSKGWIVCEGLTSEFRTLKISQKVDRVLVHLNEDPLDHYLVYFKNGKVLPYKGHHLLLLNYLKTRYKLKQDELL